MPIRSAAHRAPLGTRSAADDDAAGPGRIGRGGRPVLWSEALDRGGFRSARMEVLAGCLSWGELPACCATCGGIGSVWNSGAALELALSRSVRVATDWLASWIWIRTPGWLDERNGGSAKEHTDR